MQSLHKNSLKINWRNHLKNFWLRLMVFKGRSLNFPHATVKWGDFEHAGWLWTQKTSTWIWSVDKRNTYCTPCTLNNNHCLTDLNEKNAKTLEILTDSCLVFCLLSHPACLKSPRLTVSDIIGGIESTCRIINWVEADLISEEIMSGWRGIKLLFDSVHAL